MIEPCIIVSDRFYRLVLKEKPQPSKDEKMEKLSEVIDADDPMVKINDYKQLPSAKKIMEEHSRMRQYSFQVSDTVE
ncbi:hypothetical protein MAR_009240 [Mya arenaria]|uniref:Uncharacterized protein n=1 Tax=Mya arenaria TaxID=6604 RepID=A0ABY7E1I9_MYAAR|nr:hypothetical protein MAR_009240 [Mya arenaria]